MRIYLDTANIKEIEELFKWGCFAGVTTNPLILGKEKLTPEEAAKKIASVQPGEIFLQAQGNTPEEMESDARKLAELIPSKIMVKLPLNPVGLAVMDKLREERIWTAATAVFSVPQALLAISAGADIIIPFYGRLKANGYNPFEIVNTIQNIVEKRGGKPRLLIASIKSIQDIIEIAQIGGVWGITIPPNLAYEMLHHRLTEEALEKFSAAYHKYHEE